MRVIPGTFFITGLGRSGTLLLASILGRSRRHWVVHEWHLGPFCQDSTIRAFPLWRFYLGRLTRATRKGPGYGEVNSYLRHVLSPGRIGMERWIERRALVFRDPRDVLASAMNRAGHTGTDFDRIAYRIFADYAKLRAISQNPEIAYEVFEFERMVREPEYLAGIVRWAGVDDVEVTEADLNENVNANTKAWFPRWQRWDPAHREAVKLLESLLIPESTPRLPWNIAEP